MNVQNTEARNVFTERSEHGPLRPVRSRGERSFILMHACLFFMGPPPVVVVDTLFRTLHFLL